MEQKEFQDILKKYLQGKATPEEKRLIDSWYSAMERNIHYQRIEDEPELKTRLWSTISQQLKKTGRRANNKIPYWYITGVAASMAIALVAYSFIINQYPTIQKDVVTNEQKIAFSWRHITNSNKTPELFVLPDKSRVTIQPGSKLRYSSEYNEVIREVYLEGEAFFEVSKNAERPFFVYANEVTTKVLGTSFTVKAIEQEKQVTIAVRTGRVSVYPNHKDQSEKLAQPEEIILTPNQQVVFDKKEKKISKTLVVKPQVIIPEEEVSRMRFEEAPVSEIFKALEKVYGVEIIFDEDLLSSCELTTIIADKDIFSRLNIICDAIGASYVLENGTIIINSAGCN